MLADLLRILPNLIRFGTVHAVDVDAQRVVIALGDVRTAPLPWIAPRAGKVKVWNPPSIGEQVAVLSPNGDLAAGVAIAGIFSTGNAKPDNATADNVVIAFDDGAVIAYDMAAHHLSAILPGGGTFELKADGGLKVTGDMQLFGNLDVDGTIHATQNIASDADVRAGDISLLNHPHDKVMAGNSISGKPVAT